MSTYSHRRPSQKYQQDQLTLGGLIEQLEAVTDKTKQVLFDFCNAFPEAFPDSWRGSYDELRLPWVLPSHLSKKVPSTQELINALKLAVRSTYTGYKGGEYIMDNETPMWVDEYGRSTCTAIIGVSEDSIYVYLLTAHVEF